ncbi:16S rRNA (uracil(1498)-N(3))-methyltransferase [Daejeonella lutea]|uniref:Ribosomal RNA small subunit methyltransferase E n=1 Tax=Daejeonella lutea TaxID=572036 RepID=A0A1T5D706_9SPHI|nr:16S rRNA (uracil(1498)-N(3))-methyltransferase [Daejeonella lutea]SKB67303.1 16S rRNA (uracil1498-N3)-methyltransferase [Daejeonella lutea]
MHIFYTPDIHSDTYILSEEESKHCIKVLRLQKDSLVQLVDGKGGFYEAIISDPHPKRTSLSVIKVQEEFGRRNHHLHIAIAPTKNIERVEWFLEKATEIGIDTITPLICERSERKELKTDRLNKVITSAVKQSIKAYHPKLNEVVRFKEFIGSVSSTQKFIAHCIDGEKFTLKDKIALNSDYLVMIGPEGDFSPSEVLEALAVNFVPISLGNSRLRTETAALEACFEINYLNR